MIITSKTENIVTINLSGNELDSLKRHDALRAKITIPESDLDLIKNATKVQFESKEE